MVTTAAPSRRRRAVIASVLVMALALAVAGCAIGPRQGAPAPAPLPDGVSATDLQLQPEVVTIERPGQPVVRQTDPDGAGYLLDGTAAGIDQVSVGAVILIHHEAVGRVTALTPRGEDVHVRIEPVALTDVFRDGDIAFNDLRLDSDDLRVHSWDDPDGVEPVIEPDADGGAGGGAGGGVGADRSSTAAPMPAPRHVAAQQAPTTVLAAARDSTTTVKVGDYHLDLSFEPVAPSGVDLSIGVTRDVFTSTLDWLGLANQSSGRVAGTAKVSMRNIAITSDYQIRNGELTRGRQNVSFDGTASISMTAIAGESATLAYREVVSIPWEIHRTVFVYGVPFLVVIRVKLLISPAVSGIGTTLMFRTHADFAGSGVQDAAQPESSGEGSGSASNDGLTNRVDGDGFGVAGMVFAIRPRVGLGLGVPGANAIGFGDAVISAGVVNGSSIGITQCRKLTLDVTVRVGAEAKIFKLTAEQTHTVYKAIVYEAVAPASPACMRLLG
jgi:hypothetical protein